MSKLLFNEFTEVSSKQWKQKIQVDLKGVDYNEALIWNTTEGIDVKPFYHADEFVSPFSPSHTEASTFKICQSIYVANVKKSNEKAVDALARGAQTIEFIVPSPEVAVDMLLTDIDLIRNTIRFKLLFLSPEYVNTIPTHKHIIVQTDIIGQLCKTGNWFTNKIEDHLKLDLILKRTKSVSVNSSLYQNAGASMVQQLAYSLGHVNEYFNYLDSKLNETEKISLQFSFEVAVGTNYFFEIAKLRALRILYRTLSDAYGFNPICEIVSTPTKRNKTIYDYNTNMLRTTTECMSAILGGSNCITNLPYDSLYHKDNEFGERIARNQLLILKEESYFDKVNNPADGSYYIESLTHQLCNKALELFKHVEINGGFLTQLKTGTIQKKIKENAQKEQDLFNAGETILLGTNKYPNPEDKMKNDIEIYPFLKLKSVKTLIEPVIEKRLAETLEKQRLEQE